MKILVGEGRILCRVEEAPTESDGGILLAEVFRDAIVADKAEVLQVGDGVKQVQPKDTIYFNKLAGAEVEVEDVSYLVMEEREVLVITR